jgi:hypothetical protein
MPTLLFKDIYLPANKKECFFFNKASLIVITYYAMTDKTSISILLNSSKQVQAPVEQRPMNSFCSILMLIYSEQLKTTHNRARFRANSLQLSVLPVPAGP